MASAGAMVNSTGLRAAYAFSEGAGLSTADASGNTNTGTLVNGPTWTTQGRFGNALCDPILNSTQRFDDSQTVVPRGKRDS